MMRSLLDARQWEQKYWKKRNLNRCLLLVNQNFQEKGIALFGSYGWGDGEWMRDWETRCKEAGAVLICESVICNEMPDDEGIQSCKALGEKSGLINIGECCEKRF